ncbi:two-component sensor histidine kinase [Nostoc sp. FACHB-152]|uniref:sensor histidine kinase n=1 Tax=unclassified Nostoc TaxID=2593658 RepID=UPI001685332C|nr:MULTISPECIES: ATP-binding protein [unclassified Nostoc]MBD2447755.1 two-component sensor histidine kinase [Nostoc sp. FACHB-152]MBD2467046.1 two-component sensor histidine kinase [Nostoc sp. FACHB-145]
MNQLKQLLQKIDPFSLRVRLSVGVAAVSALGLGSLSIWTSWKMQQLLINKHKNNIQQIATRLPHDIELYHKMMPSADGEQKIIDSLSTNNTFLWIKSFDNKILAKSQSLNHLSQPTVSQLISLTEMSMKPQVKKVDERYFVLCGGALPLRGKVMGQLFVVQDVTYEQTMFLVIVQSIEIGSICTIIVISLAIALYIQRSLQPLRQLSQMTEVISIADLGQAQLYLDNAPSEVRELAQTCNMMLSRLAQAWEQERQFVSNVSHELRTPLTIVHGYLQSVLRRQSNLTEIQREALTTASAEAERTIRLLQDLLDLARADSGYLHFRLERCVVNDLVAEVVAMAEIYSDRQITIESASQPIVVKADYNRLKQVLLNLTDNAVKYSEPETPVAVKLHQQGDEAIIQVCDQGYGIPLQHQSRIFERFYRVDEARTSSTGGCGLGLSIVKTLVEGMGGHVTVRSRLGEGSMFTITLPAYSF